MVKKDVAKSRIIGGTPPSMTAPIEFDEICRLCENYIKDGQFALRHKQTNGIICLSCWTYMFLEMSK